MSTGGNRHYDLNLVCARHDMFGAVVTSLMLGQA